MTPSPLRRALRRSRPAPTQAAPHGPAAVLDAGPDALPGAEPDPGPDAVADAVHGRGRSRAVRLGALLAAAVVLATGSVAVARAHKTVTLDVDGQVRDVGTFAGSVAGLLAEEGVEVDARDVLAPAAGTGLRSGDEVVVRHAHALAVQVDGSQTTVWTTALSADEALVSLATRGDDVRLIASRSNGGARADLALRLRTDGPVEVHVDGRVERVPDGGAGLAEVLAGLRVSLARDDRVTVQPAEPGGPLRVVVQRVVVRTETVAAPVPFETVTQESDDLYRGQSRTLTEGVQGS